MSVKIYVIPLPVTSTISMTPSHNACIQTHFLCVQTAIRIFRKRTFKLTTILYAHTDCFTLEYKIVKQKTKKAKNTVTTHI